jgi:hypothetical protein
MDTVEGNEAKRGRGRPRKLVSEQVAESRDVRRDSASRVPVSGVRDKLTVKLNPDTQNNFKLRWVKDANIAGSRILRFQEAGYTFVTNQEVTSVGEDSVKAVDGLGSIICQPAGKEYNKDGSPVYLYLMKIPKDFYDEDFAAKQKHVTEKERATLSEFSDSMGEDAYGSIKISR